MGIMQLGAGLAGGVLLALAHFSSLALNVRLYLDGRSLWAPVLLQLVRFLVTAVALTLVVRAVGGEALLAVLAGFTVARLLWLRPRS